MAIECVTMLRDRRGYCVDVKTSAGEQRRFRYASEAQARYFAAVFSLGPTALPSLPARRRRKVREQAETSI